MLGVLCFSEQVDMFRGKRRIIQANRSETDEKALLLRIARSKHEHASGSANHKIKKNQSMVKHGHPASCTAVLH